MKFSRMCVGRGDFGKMAETLIRSEDSKHEADLINKIMLIRNQCIFKKEFMDSNEQITKHDLYNEERKNMRENLA